MFDLKEEFFTYYFVEQDQQVKELKGKASIYTEVVEDVAFDLVSLPGGVFSMGAKEDEKEHFDNECPLHSVTVKPFFIGRYPVTQKLWKKIMGNNPSYFEGDDRPVEGVSWSHAYHFCEFLKAKTNKNYRLITEAEWEYACRGNLTTPYHTGYYIDGTMANFNLIGSFKNGNDIQPIGETTAVGSYPPNPFGLYDMCGNVWEWCADIGHRDYKTALSQPVDSSACMELQDFTPWVLRGGSFDNKARTLRCANRFKSCPTNRFNTLGFRIALS